MRFDRAKIGKLFPHVPDWALIGEGVSMFITSPRVVPLLLSTRAIAYAGGVRLWVMGDRSTHLPTLHGDESL